MAVVAFLLYLTFTAEHKVDTVANRERPTLTVDVTGAKWEWEFSYPQYGIVHRSGTVGRQPLVVPVNEAIRFNLTSQDVLHSFWVPEAEFKHDLFPGNVQHVTLTLTRTGLFSGQCAEFCGLRHPDMVFNVRVLGVHDVGALEGQDGILMSVPTVPLAPPPMRVGGWVERLVPSVLYECSLGWTRDLLDAAPNRRVDERRERPAALET